VAIPAKRDRNNNCSLDDQEVIKPDWTPERDKKQQMKRLPGKGEELHRELPGMPRESEFLERRAVEFDKGNRMRLLRWEN